MLRLLFNNCWMALKQISGGKYSVEASALAFTTALSIVPMITVFVYLLSHFVIFSEMMDSTKNYVITNFVPTSSQEIIFYLNKFTLQATKLPLWSILFLFITTIILMIAIDDSMRVIWQKKPKDKSIFYYLFYPITVLLIPILIIISALINALLSYVMQYFPDSFILISIVPIIINTILIAILYYVTMSFKINWRSILLGAFIAAIGLSFAKNIFAIYVDQFSNYHIIYGTLATIPVFLIWLYIFWIIILYGALVVMLNHQS